MNNFKVLQWFDENPTLTVEEIKKYFLPQSGMSWDEAHTILIKITNEYGWLNFTEHSKGSDLNKFSINKIGDSVIDKKLERTIKSGLIKEIPIRLWHIRVTIIGILVTTFLSILTFLKILTIEQLLEYL